MKAAICATIISVCFVVAMAQGSSELSGHVKYGNNSPARGVVVSIGSYSVATDANGYYKLSPLRPGTKVVSLTPPGKATREFGVTVGSTPTSRDFVVDW